eukprot:1015625-Pyramimonas_sp.AAC.1
MRRSRGSCWALFGALPRRPVFVAQGLEVGHLDPRRSNIHTGAGGTSGRLRSRLPTFSTWCSSASCSTQSTLPPSSTSEAPGTTSGSRTMTGPSTLSGRWASRGLTLLAAGPT